MIVVVFLAAFQAKRHYGDLLLLLSFGILGWLMKRFGWPRPPLILGLVLSSVLENYFFISASHFGVSWLWRPIVLVIGALIVASLVYGRKWGQPGWPGRTRSRGFRAAVPVPPQRADRVHRRHLPAGSWRSGHRPRVARPGRLFSLVVGVSAVAMCAAQLLLDLFRIPVEGGARIMDLEAERGVPGRIVARRGRRHLRLDRGPPGVHLGHGLPAERAPLHVAVSGAPCARPLVALLGYTALALAVLLGVFHYTLHIPWPEGLSPVRRRWCCSGWGVRYEATTPNAVIPRETGCVNPYFGARKATPPHSRESGNPGGVEGCNSGVSPPHPAWIPASRIDDFGVCASLGWGLNTSLFVGMTISGGHCGGCYRRWLAMNPRSTSLNSLGCSR